MNAEEPDLKDLITLITKATRTAEDMFMQDAKSGETPAHRAFAHMIAAYVITNTQGNAPTFMAVCDVVNNVMPNALRMIKIPAPS